MMVGITRYVGQRGTLWSLLQQDDILHMLRVGEHIDWLNAPDFIGFGKQLKVASLGGRVAADIDDTFRSSKQDSLYDARMHTGSGWVGNDDVGLSVMLDEVAVKDVLHVACKELGILDAIYL